MDPDEITQDIPTALVTGALIALLATVTATMWLSRQTTMKRRSMAKQTNDKEQDSPKLQSMDSPISSPGESPSTTVKETDEASDEEETNDDEMDMSTIT